MKTCRHCGEPSQTAQRRPGSFTVLCVECYLDSKAPNAQDTECAPDVRVWTPRETGVLKYQPFRVINRQGGGR